MKRGMSGVNFRIRIGRNNTVITVPKDGDMLGHVHEARPREVARLLRSGGVDVRKIFKDIRAHFAEGRLGRYEINGFMRKNDGDTTVRFEVPKHYLRNKEK